MKNINNMKIKKVVNGRLLLTAIALLPAITSCSDSWLEPKPLSFYTPDNSYVNAEGFYSALTTCERNMRQIGRAHV